MNKKRGPFGQEYRLRFIEKVIAQYGVLNRDFVADYFGISIPQVSLDIRAYIELAPKNIRYDESERRYVIGDRFSGVFE
jgi:hypothetical protein